MYVKKGSQCRDMNGNILHIGEEITLSQWVRPKRLIGYHGIVERLGDKRVKIKLVPESEFKFKNSFVRVEPIMLIRGYHKVQNPILDNPKLLAFIKSTVSNHAAGILLEGVKVGIITKKQYEQLVQIFTKNN